MAAITAGMVKELRDKTGAGMMDCKTALSAVDGDIEAAIDWLRTKGLAKAAKKAGRVAAEGLVAVAISGHNGVVIELNSETDFVARNAEFQEIVATIAKVAIGAKGDVAALAQYSLPDAVGVLQKICHDLMALACDAAPRYFAPASLPSQPLAMDLLEKWSRELLGQARTAEHPFNAGLMHEALAARAQAVLLSGRAARKAARAAQEQPNP